MKYIYLVTLRRFFILANSVNLRLHLANLKLLLANLKFKWCSAVLPKANGGYFVQHSSSIPP